MSLLVCTMKHSSSLYQLGGPLSPHRRYCLGPLVILRYAHSRPIPSYPPQPPPPVASGNAHFQQLVEKFKEKRLQQQRGETGGTDNQPTVGVNGSRVTSGYYLCISQA